jgi:hypothetical protein
MPPRRILVITGASGSGKTAIVSALASEPNPRISYHHFDSIGVPSPDAMAKEYGSGEGWQGAMTDRWIARLSQDPGDQTISVLEGQVRPSRVLEAFRASTVQRGSLLLLDCSPEIREARLYGPRGQPELANPQMMTWAAYLRGQADALHVPVLDTTSLRFDESVAAVREHIAALLATAD